jgi:hypothetical protein
VGASILPMFHVSQLKQAIGCQCHSSVEFPLELTRLQSPEKVLDKRMINRGIRPVVQVLV